MENNESFKAVEEIFDNIKKEFLTTKPMWIRLNLLASMFSKAKNDGVPENNIDWDKVNDYLKQNVDEYDFNVFDDFHTYEDVFEAAMASKTNCIIGPWRKGVCKDCGRTFYMSYEELNFFKNKGLKIPKRCKECRKKRKINKNV